MPPPDTADAEPAEEPPVIDGLVQRHDEAGRLVEEACFCAGRLDGAFRLFGPDGALRRLAHYVDGLADGLATDYDDAGQKLAETHWQAGLRHGPARLYSDGRLAQAMQWRHGRLDGPLHVYGPGGELAAVMPYREGRLHGTLQIYHPNGWPMLEAEHVGGLRHGPSALRDADGQVIERVDYVEGRPEGAPLTAPESETAIAAGDPLRSFYAGLAREG